MTKSAIQTSIPELDILPLTNNEITLKYRDLIKNSGIKKFSPVVEIWTSNASNKALSYYSHGIFRYFGKFPPPVARHLIKNYTREKDLIIDPMCGSGTSGLEALLLNRTAYCFDISPLSILISRVKVTQINKEDYLNTFETIKNIYYDKKIKEYKIEPVGLKNSLHWFLPETIKSLSKIKFAIETASKSVETKEALLVAFLSIVRRVSKATTQQGRLFLDIETAEKNAFPFFEKKALDQIEQLSLLPKSKNIKIEQYSILNNSTKQKKRSKLIICHPPYFNSYKYSGVNSLELAWLGVDHATIRKSEVRESFKVGKVEKVEEYLADMEQGVRNLGSYLEPKGIIALMIGDTMIKGQYVPVTHKLIERLKDIYTVEKSALRIPKFTESSWAASQRRKGSEVGINLCDLVIILKKV